MNGECREKDRCWDCEKEDPAHDALFVVDQNNGDSEGRMVRKMDE